MDPAAVTQLEQKTRELEVASQHKTDFLASMYRGSATASAICTVRR